MCTGVEVEDEAEKILRGWYRKSKKGSPKCISFRIDDGLFVVEKQSDGSKSPKEQFNDFKDSFTPVQTRIWLAKVSYDKNGQTREDIVYLLRKGRVTKDYFKAVGKPAAKKLKNDIIIYAMSGKVLKGLVPPKYVHEYEDKDADYDTIAKALADRL